MNTQKPKLTGRCVHAKWVGRLRARFHGYRRVAPQRVFGAEKEKIDDQNQFELSGDDP